MEILKDARAKIDDLDVRIVDLLTERFKIVRAVGQLKADNAIPVVQGDRVEQVKTRVYNLARERGLDGELLRAIYTLIIDHAHSLESGIGQKDQKK
jgi:chorismate mutase